MAEMIMRLAEDIFTGIRNNGDVHSSSSRCAESESKSALFFTSPFMPMRFLSTMVVLTIETPVNYLEQAFCCDTEIGFIADPHLPQIRSVSIPTEVPQNWLLLTHISKKQKLSQTIQKPTQLKETLQNHLYERPLWAHLLNPSGNTSASCKWHSPGPLSCAKGCTVFTNSDFRFTLNLDSAFWDMSGFVFLQLRGVTLTSARPIVLGFAAVPRESCSIAAAKLQSLP
ncbi:coiled-coil domain-containing protein 138 isoform X1 [Centrocercus urophasianus]|uniref:coiled-coil domain-containing protein 138 isoform X1 n=1 Tax=Centrocercus urophasianus TaxID=9002 RepID=UPI001C65349A|nr:coiled-coil domain-containing protein 138 isoform X1 [Centrocercus urophasianus]